MRIIVKSARVVVLLGLAAGCRSTPSSGEETDFAAIGDPVHAYVEAMRLELDAGKTDIYEDAMSPTPEEAAVFGPIFGEYEAELYVVGDRRLALARKLAEAYDSGTLDAAAATEIGAAWLKVQQESLDLVKKYHERIAKELSPLQAAQFLQIEHRVATVVDLLTAAEFPLLRLDPIDADPAPAGE